MVLKRHYRRSRWCRDERTSFEDGQEVGSHLQRSVGRETAGLSENE